MRDRFVSSPQVVPKTRRRLNLCSSGPGHDWLSVRDRHVTKGVCYTRWRIGFHTGELPVMLGDG